MKNKSNSIAEKREKIFDAIKNCCTECEAVFLCLTGDIANAGSEEEYDEAVSLFEYLTDSIKQYSDKKIYSVIIPGNHDCNFAQENSVRDLIISKIHDDPSTNIKPDFIEACCAIQSEFFEFCDWFEDADSALFHHKLIKIWDFDLGTKKIRITGYNTAWMSQLQENQGKLIFPFDRLKIPIFEEVSLQISLLHHPYNWNQANNARRFFRQIVNQSDIVLTGHEHVSSDIVTYDQVSDITEYVEGAVLQNHDDENDSGFNIIIIDLEEEKRKSLNFSWNGRLYKCNDSKDEWVAYKKLNKNRIFQINPAFLKRLEDPGASFSHPRKGQILLDDVYIYPNLKDLQVRDKNGHKFRNTVIESSTLFIKNQENKVVLVGEEKSGKTALCKKLFSYYFNSGDVPIYLQGKSIKTSSIEEIEKFIKKVFASQYNIKEIQEFDQLDYKKKVIIIDDLHKSPLNSKYRTKFIHNLCQKYDRVIITVNDFYRMEDLASNSSKEYSLQFKHFEIMQFGHLLRSRLINRWNNLGREEYLEEKDLIRENDRIKQIIDKIIGKNLVPSYPFFLLTMLQSNEIHLSHNLSNSTYGYYYSVLITTALSKINLNNEEIDAYNNYLTELAYCFFSKNITQITNEDFRLFHKEFCTKYDIEPDYNENKNMLIIASILDEYDENYCFTYDFIYYYYVGSYLARNLSDPNIRKQISEMCKRIYREEFANIIMFLTHLSKDPFIVEEIIKQGQEIFSEFPVATLEKHTLVVNDLLDEIPKLVLERREISKTREDKLILEDEAEMINGHNDASNEKDFNFDDDVSQLDNISKLNLAFKTIEIMGQILKNYYGSHIGPVKLDLCSEAYMIGLRALNSFCSVLEDNRENLVELIESIQLEEGLNEPEKIKKNAKKTVFMFYLLICYSFIKKTAEAVGFEKLLPTFEKILAGNNTTAVSLIDISIKLDFFKGLPISEIKKLKERYKDNVLAETILQYLVLNYIYMFPTTEQDKHRISNMFGIPIDAQIAIDHTSAEKKQLAN